MIDPGHKRLSIVRQCELVSISRASFYRPSAGESEENLALMRLIDETFLECRRTFSGNGSSFAGALAASARASSDRRRAPCCPRPSPM